MQAGREHYGAAPRRTRRLACPVRRTDPQSAGIEIGVREYVSCRCLGTLRGAGESALLHAAVRCCAVVFTLRVENVEIGSAFEIALIAQLAVNDWPYRSACA